MEVTCARFIPARPGEHNRLEVAVRSLPETTRSPCRVKLNLHSDRELSPIVGKPSRGTFEGVLERGGQALTLFAEDLRLDPNANEQGQFSLSVDGLERALWFQVRFPPQGEAQDALPMHAPRVRFHPQILVKPGQPAKLQVRFEVDNVADDSKLTFHLGRGTPFQDDIQSWTATAKRRHLGFDPRGEDG